jgi:hypothetical protein
MLPSPQHHFVSLHPQNTQHALALFELPQTIHGIPVLSILGSNHMSPAVPLPQSSFAFSGMWRCANLIILPPVIRLLIDME